MHPAAQPKVYYRRGHELLRTSSRQNRAKEIPKRHLCDTVLDILGKEKRDKEKPLDFLAPESRGVHPAAQSSMGATSYELSQSQ